MNLKLLLFYYIFNTIIKIFNITYIYNNNIIS